jgi:hypothetical protein
MRWQHIYVFLLSQVHKFKIARLRFKNNQILIFIFKSEEMRRFTIRFLILKRLNHKDLVHSVM